MKAKKNNVDWGMVGKLIPAPTCTAVVLHRNSFLLYIPNADWEPVWLCRKCFRELTAKYDAIGADYSVLESNGVVICDFCKDGVVDELEYHLEIAEAVGRAS